jgi:multiple sugar transport system permease protein
VARIAARGISLVVRAAIFVLYTVILLAMVFPVYWLVVTSVKPAYLEQTNPPVFFPALAQLTLFNYFNVLGDSSVRLFIENSAIVAVSTMFVTVVIGSLAAYALAKTFLNYRLRRSVLLSVLLMRIFPPIVVALPYFTLLQGVGLTDTRVGLILTHVAVTLPFVIWLMLGFFQDLPPELDEAGMLDGCSLLQRFIRLNLPLVLPGLAVTSIFAFILSWNEFLFADILTSFNARTLPVQIASYIGERSLEWGSMSALATLMLVVPAILAFAGQRYMVRGLTFGAVK